MAYINFELSTITNAGTTEGTGLGALSFYGTKFGLGPGYWLRLPLVAEPIGDCCTTTPQVLDSWGLYYWVGTTSPGYNAHDLQVLYLGPLKVNNFEKGGRWLYIGPLADLVPAELATGACLKRMDFYYRSTQESGKPPALGA